MISPIKTIIKNLSNNTVRFRISSRLAVAMTPKGTSGDVATLSGDIFTMLDSNNAALYLLNIVKTGIIELSYSIDPAFIVNKSEDVNMAVPCGDISVWYNALCVPATKSAKSTAQTKEEPKQKPVTQEVPKPQDAPKATEQSKEEPKPADKPEMKPVEPVNDAPESMEEAQRTEETKPAEPKKEAPKAGRKIKVQ